MYGKMYIEKPTVNQNYIKPDETTVNLVGWAVSDDSKASLQVFIDGKTVNSAISRSPRADVDKAVSSSYGGTAVTPKAGFSANLNISTISAGQHTIKVRQVSRYGVVICESERNITISNKKYIRKNVHRKAFGKSKLY